jgi:hypothetical protein
LVDSGSGLGINHMSVSQGLDLVFSSDNHNYQRTFPLKYNSNADSSNNPIIVDRNQNNYKNNDKEDGVIYLITGTAGRSHYELEGQTSTFCCKTG